MKRYIRCSQVDPNYDYGGKYRYWDDASLADKATGKELPSSVKEDIFETILEDMKYNTDIIMGDKSELWDYFVNRVTSKLQDVLEYDYPDSSWKTWYEDARRRFNEWWSS